MERTTSPNIPLHAATEETVRVSCSFSNSRFQDSVFIFCDFVLPDPVASRGRLSLSLFIEEEVEAEIQGGDPSKSGGRYTGVLVPTRVLNTHTT